MSRIPREIQLSSVLAMLNKCATGHTVRVTDHRVLVVWQGDSFSLPSGKHVKLERAIIGTSQVRTMVRQFGIQKCAAEMLPALAGSF
jgi:hypothetical protein